MPVTITINGTTSHETLEELRGLTALLHSAAPALQAEPVPEAERREFPAAVETKRRGKAKAEAPVAPEAIEEIAMPEMRGDRQADSQETAPVIDPLVSETPFTFDDVRAAAVDLGSQADGKEKCRAVLTEFGAAKLSELKPEQFKAFIAAVAKKRGL